MTDSKRAHYPSLAGRGVFITGGGSGIGAAFVEAFARNGASVAFIDVDDAASLSLVEHIREHFGRTVWYRQIDVTDSGVLEASIREASAEIGGLDVLINNVGNDMRHAVDEYDAEGWRRCMSLNLDSAYVAARAVVPELKKRGGGSIINLGSIVSLLGLGNMPGYVTAKAGTVGLTKALARDLGEHEIRVNAILPGWVVTQKQLDKWLTPEVEAEWQRQVALKRRLLPADVADLALFLAADDSSMITGQSLVIDAGRT